MRAIADAVEARLWEEKCQPLGIEGLNAAHWVLVDCNDVILHVFRKEARLFYNLDWLWGDAPRIDFSETALIPVKKISRTKKVKVN